MSAALRKATRLFSNLCAGGAGLSMLGLFLVIFVNSARRYTLGKSLEWGEELPVFLSIYGVMFGMAWAYLQDRHVRFTILVAFIPRTGIERLYLLVDVVMVFLGGMLAWSGYLFAEKRGAVEASGLINGARALRDATGWDGFVVLGQMYPYQFAMAVGGVLLAIAATLRLLDRVASAIGERARGEAG